MKSALALLPAILVTPLLSAAPVERSISTSRQFIVYGTNVGVRGAVADLAERTKADLLRTLQTRDDWKTPIVINARFPEANVPELPPAELHFSQTGFGLKLQLDLTITAEVNAPAVQREILRPLLLERSYRNYPGLAAGSIYTAPPPWLVEALLASADPAEMESLARDVAAANETRQFMTLEQVVRQKPELLDASGRVLFRGYSLALLEFLLSEATGAAQLNKYIESLPRATNDPVADLRASFPAVADGEEQIVVWKAAVAKFVSTTRYRILTIPETEAQLDQLLATKIPGDTREAKALPLEELAGVQLSKAQRAWMIALNRRLALLAAAANPVMRPLVQEYSEIWQRLALGKHGKLKERLARLKSARAELKARMSAVDDYMNWFEATQLKAQSGVFAEYLRSAERSGQAERPRRRDPLSVYLDAMETQFGN